MTARMLNVRKQVMAVKYLGSIKKSDLSTGSTSAKIKIQMVLLISVRLYYLHYKLMLILLNVLIINQITALSLEVQKSSMVINDNNLCII